MLALISANRHARLKKLPVHNVRVTADYQTIDMLTAHRRSLGRIGLR